MEAALALLAALLESGEKSVAALGAASASLAAAVTQAAGGADACVGDLAPAAAGWDVQEQYLLLARLFEREFNEDMDALGVMRPDVVTRVSDYVPQIVEYIQAIIGKGAFTLFSLLSAACLTHYGQASPTSPEGPSTLT